MPHTLCLLTSFCDRSYSHSNDCKSRFCKSRLLSGIYGASGSLLLLVADGSLNSNNPIFFRFTRKYRSAKSGGFYFFEDWVDTAGELVFRMIKLQGDNRPPKRGSCIPAFGSMMPWPRKLPRLLTSPPALNTFRTFLR